MPFLTVREADLSEANEVQGYPLGYRYIEPPLQGDSSSDDLYDSGEREWIYVKNGSGASIAPGRALSKRTHAAGANPKYVCGLTQVGQHVCEIVGISQYAIPDGYYGFVLRRGYCTLVTGTTNGLTENTPMKVTTAAGEHGFLMDALIGAPAVGLSGAAIASGGASGAGFVNCVG